MRNLEIPHFVMGLVACLTLSTPAFAQGDASAAADKWYSVATSDSEEAFVNETAITLVGTDVQVKVKQNYRAPVPAVKKGKTYQSVRTVYRLKCAERKIAMADSKFFEAADLQGKVVQKASRSDKNLIWMDAPRATVFGEILDYGCRKAPQAATPTN